MLSRTDRTKDITQHIEITNSDAERMAALKRILEGLGDSGNVLIFCNTKKKCRELSWELDNQFKALKAVELHGDLEQWQRDESLNKFRSGDVRILAATDVAARGLDIRNVSVVVNFDAPNNAEDCGGHLWCGSFLLPNGSMLASTLMAVRWRTRAHASTRYAIARATALREKTWTCGKDIEVDRANPLFVDSRPSTLRKHNVVFREGKRENRKERPRERKMVDRDRRFETYGRDRERQKT